jgi:Carboxypeptidase regulatory-like domain
MAQSKVPLFMIAGIVWLLLLAELEAAEIVGRVADADTGQGLPGAIVRAIPLSRGQREVQDVARDDGRYQLDLVRGKYRLFVSLPDSNYLARFYAASGDPEGDVLDVAAFESFRIMDISLAAGGSIAGTVLRSTDLMPVANMRVEAVSGGFRSATQTASDGSYLLRALPPGGYRIRVVPMDENFVSLYFGDTRDSEKAAVISLGRHEKVSNIDFDLRYGGVISGRVYANKNREPIAGLRIIAENQSQQEPPYFTATDAQGFYTLQGLAEGSYIIETSWPRESTQSRPKRSYVMQFHEERFDRELADKLEVEPGTVFTGVNFAMVEAASISGTVRSRYHNRPVSGVLLRSQHVAKAILNPFQGKTGLDGDYLISGIAPGDYVVDTVLPEPIRLVNFFYRDKLSLEKADQIGVEEGERIRHIDFNLPLGGTIRGGMRVEDPEYTLQPAGKAVSLKREGLDLEGFGKRDFKLKQDGSFLIDRAPPGLYSLSPVLDDPNLMPQANAREKAIEVTEGSLIEGVEFPLKVMGSITGTISSQEKSLDLEKLVLMLVSLRDNARTYYELTTAKYTLPGLEAGKYFMVLLTKPDPSPTPIGLATGQVFDMRVVDVQRGKTTAGVNLQVPADPNPRGRLSP